MKESIVCLCVHMCLCADTRDGWPFMADQSQTVSENENIKNNLLRNQFGSFLYSFGFIYLFVCFYFKSMRSVRPNKQETIQSNYSQSGTNL